MINRMETLIEYMERRLVEFRKMQPITIMPLQRDFPGCEKYKTCCNTIDVWSMDKMRDEINLQHKVFKVHKIRLVPRQPPEGFETINPSEL